MFLDELIVPACDDDERLAEAKVMRDGVCDVTGDEIM